MEFIRKIDDLNRIVLPKALLNVLGLQPRSKVQIRLDGEGIRLSPAEDSCAVCRGSEGLRALGESYLCEKCLSAARAQGE